VAIAGTVLVSGASTGIGRACALELSRHDFRVFGGVRDSNSGAALEEDSGGRVVPVLLDVTSTDLIASAVEELTAATEGLGLAGLVNNAGIAVAGPLEFLPVESFREQLEVNVVGLLTLTQACLPLLRRGRGRIVNMGSISGRIAPPLVGAYSASKFALAGLSDALRRELAPWGLSVSLVEPGRVSTPIWQKSAQEAERLFQGMPVAAEEYYGPQLARARGAALAAEREGVPSSRVARAVTHALTASRPRARYLVGPDARIGALVAALLPVRWLDNFLARGY
jgi:NAD(P)-dependent dehydrogenase (short-subunit alcohol dehydrogenase family)